MTNIFKNRVFERFLLWREKFNDYPYRSYMDHHRCIFIHIPKAAGTSVLKVLAGKKINRDHCSYNIFYQASRKKFKYYYKFCFVRNPYTRLRSVYQYLKTGGNGKNDLELQNIIMDRFSTFDEFILEFLDKDLIHQMSLLKPQYAFVCNYKYDLMVDFCGRFENLHDDFSIVCKNLNIKEDLPKLNKTDYESSDKERALFSREVLDKINYLYEKDFEIFGYEFE